MGNYIIVCFYPPTNCGGHCSNGKKKYFLFSGVGNLILGHRGVWIGVSMALTWPPHTKGRANQRFAYFIVSGFGKGRVGRRLLELYK